MRRFASLFRSGLALIILVQRIQAGPISIIGIGDPSDSAVALGGNQILGESWSSSNSYSNVDISAHISRAFCCPTDPIVFITAYLTNQIGPGSMIGNQIAMATVAVPDPGSKFVPLFSGLSLGPGSYFLTLAAADPNPSGTGAWFDSPFPPHVEADSGVAWLGAYGIYNVGNPDFSYPPDSAFVSGGDYSFQVTGNPEPAPLPEPSTFLLFGLGFVFESVANRWRRGRTERRVFD